MAPGLTGEIAEPGERARRLRILWGTMLKQPGVTPPPLCKCLLTGIYKPGLDDTGAFLGLIQTSK